MPPKQSDYLTVETTVVDTGIVGFSQSIIQKYTGKREFKPGEIIFNEKGIRVGIAVTTTKVLLQNEPTVTFPKYTMRKGVKELFDLLENVQPKTIDLLIKEQPHLIRYVEYPSLEMQKIAVKADVTDLIRNPHPSIELMKL